MTRHQVGVGEGKVNAQGTSTRVDMLCNWLDPSCPQCPASWLSWNARDITLLVVSCPEVASTALTHMPVFMADVEDGEDDGGAGNRPEREVRVGQDHRGWRGAAAAVRTWVSMQA